jgi:hypothetical protein
MSSTDSFSQENLSCTDILDTFHNALNACIIPFNTTVAQYTKTMELITSATTIPDAESLGMEAHALLNKMSTILYEHKALLESLPSVNALANLLVQSTTGKSMGMDEEAARGFVEKELAGYWAGYEDAFERSCIEKRRGDVENEVYLVSETIVDMQEEALYNGGDSLDRPWRI